MPHTDPTPLPSRSAAGALLRSCLALSLLVILAAPALAQYGRGGPSRDNELRLRLGLFQPDGDSEYWQFGDVGDPDDKVFTGDAEDFEDLQVGIEYVRHVGPRLGWVLGVSGYEGEEEQAYLFFEDQFGGDIVHTTRVEVGTLTAGLMFHFLERHRRLVPYVGIGGGLYVWNLEEAGDFIDFGTFPLEIFRTRFEDDGETFGWYWHAGVRLGLTRNWSFFGEYREHDADDELSGDFEGFGDLDLSGEEVSGGFVWTF